MLDQEITDVIVKSETKRTRRTKQEMAAASYVPPDVRDEALANASNPTVEIADLEPPITASQEDFISQSMLDVNITNKIAELHIGYEADGVARRVEFRGADGITFVIPQVGEVKWVSFAGDIRKFPDFLATLTVLDTVSV